MGDGGKLLRAIERIYYYDTKNEVMATEVIKEEFNPKERRVQSVK